MQNPSAPGNASHVYTAYLKDTGESEPQFFYFAHTKNTTEICQLFKPVGKISSLLNGYLKEIILLSFLYIETMSIGYFQPLYDYILGWCKSKRGLKG